LLGCVVVVVVVVVDDDDGGREDEEVRLGCYIGVRRRRSRESRIQGRLGPDDENHGPGKDEVFA
jgi:hypothetical protein